MNFLVYLIIGIPRVTFGATAFIWSFYLSLLSMKAPRYLTESFFCSIGSPDITIFALKGSVVALSFIVCLMPMTQAMKLVLFLANKLCKCQSCSNQLKDNSGERKWK